MKKNSRGKQNHPYPMDFDKLLRANRAIGFAANRSELLKMLRQYINIPINGIICLLADNDQEFYHIGLFDNESGRKSQVTSSSLMKAVYPFTDKLISELSIADKPLILSTAQMDKIKSRPGWLAPEIWGDAKTVVCLNLTNNTKHIGLLVLSSNEELLLSANDITALNSIAITTGLALINIIARDEARARLRERDIMLELGNSIGVIRNKAGSARTINEHLKKIIPIDQVIICKISEDKSWYTPYIFEVQADLRNDLHFAEALLDKSKVDSGLVNLLYASDGPLVFDLDELIGRDDLPAFLRLKHSFGTREVVYALSADSFEPQALIVFCLNEKNLLSKQHLDFIKNVSSFLSAAISSIAINDEILQREKEKTALLSFSNNIAAVRDRNHLSAVIRQGLSNLFKIELYILSLKNDDNTTHSYFLIDAGSRYELSRDFDKIRDNKFPIKNGMAEVVFESADPVIFEVDQVIKEKKINFPTASFWKSIGVDSILGVPLRVGEQDIGILWAHAGKVNNRLMKGVASQIAIALAHYVAAQKVEKQFNEISDFKQRLEIENKYLQEEIGTTHNYNEIVGESASMHRVFELVSQVASSDSSVLILGETGTGKELIARAVHNNSPRKGKLMVKINCATLPANLIESELFGHERGSFTGAIDRRIGKFELADNSTLFLDEIGEMPLDLQVKLLRAIQEKEIERIGGRSVIKTNVRIIAATNRDLLKEVSQGNFRSDLYFRLNVFPIEIPPLRARRDDISKLANHFLLRFAAKNAKHVMSFSASAVAQMENYNWPGNVRELEHLIERSVLINKKTVIEDLYLNDIKNEDGRSSNYVKTIDEVEREHIIEVLKRCNGKVAGPGGAAEILRIPSTTLNSKIIRLKIKKGLSI